MSASSFDLKSGAPSGSFACAALGINAWNGADTRLWRGGCGPRALLSRTKLAIIQPVKEAWCTKEDAPFSGSLSRPCDGDTNQRKVRQDLMAQLRPERCGALLVLQSADADCGVTSLGFASSGLEQGDD